MPDQWIYWLEELGQEHNKVVGKKCANLGELTKAGFRVPPGFALGVEAYTRFMNETKAGDILKEQISTFDGDPENLADMLKFEDLSKRLRTLARSVRMPYDMEETVRNYYGKLCAHAGGKDVYVATRSAGTESHPGQYETYLNVCGADDVVSHVVGVWASTFNTRSLIARARLGLPLHYDPIGTAVLTMVDAKAAGVMFTVNPANGDKSKVAIEASCGCGEAVVSGSVTPDRYLIDKVTLEIEEKVISGKGSEFVYNPATKKMEYRELSADRRNAACLDDSEVLELTRTAKKVEAHFGCPQDIEFSISGSLPFPESVFLVQARAESVWGKKKKESVLGKKTGLDLLFEKALTPTKISI